jgi:hypothetical protein
MVALPVPTKLPNQNGDDQVAHEHSPKEQSPSAKRPMAHTLVDTPTSCVHIENTRHDEPHVVVEAHGLDEDRRVVMSGR